MKLRSLKHKFQAKRCSHQELKFRSKLEKNTYLALLSLKENGKLLFITREFPVDLPGGIKHYVDFLVWGPDEAWLIESKGLDKEPGRSKRKIAEEILGVQIHVVTDPVQIFGVINPIDPIEQSNQRMVDSISSTF